MNGAISTQAGRAQMRGASDSTPPLLTPAPVFLPAMHALADEKSTETDPQPPVRTLPTASFRMTLSHPSAYNYVARLATSPKDVQAAQRIRFEVFNLELGEGLEQSKRTGLDSDPFDEVCDHLIVENQQTGEVVGTYRMQTGPQAARYRGYYSAREFDFSPFEPWRAELVELGRACVAREHRNLLVLQLLWRGIAFYARTFGARYLVGCSSINSQEPAVGAALYSALIRRHFAPVQFQTRPLPELACSLTALTEEAPKVPKLLGAYLALGATICGPPALDREFRTIDFLTLLDLKNLPKRSVDKFLR